MPVAFLVSYVVLWLFVIVMGFLLFAYIRQIGLLSWRMEQVAAATPSRIERGGLKVGAQAPDFRLRDVSGRDVSLQNHRGKQTLLVFTQPGCGPCRTLAADLNRLVNRDGLAILAISNGDEESNLAWAADVKANFPVLTQQHYSVSKKYQSFATPFAFLVDEEGVIRAQGIVNEKQHIDLLLASARKAKTKAREPQAATVS